MECLEGMGYVFDLIFLIDVNDSWLEIPKLFSIFILTIADDNDLITYLPFRDYTVK